MYYRIFSKSRKMVVFTERQQKILLKLINNKNGLSLAELEQQLGISQRTLYREFADLRPSLRQEGAVLTSKNGIYQVEGSAATLNNIEISLAGQKNTLYLATPSRQNAVICILLLSTAEMKINNLALTLEVSQGTIQRDLDAVAKSLKAYGLSLVRKKGVGILISGSEEIRRYLFCRIVLQEINEYQFLQGLANKEISGNLFAVLIPTDLLLECYQTLADCVLPQLTGIYDRQTISLVLMFSLSLYRFKNGCVLTNTVDNNIKPKYVKLVKDFLTRLKYHDIGHKLTENEINFLALQLQNSDRIKAPSNIDDMDLSLSLQVKEFVSLVSTAYGWDFTRNPDFSEKITLHIKSLLQKSQPVLPENSLESITYLTEKYQKLITVISEKWAEVFTNKKLHQYEKQLLLLYFANEIENHKYRQGLSALVICENGFSTSQILKSRLQQEIPELTQIDTTKITKLNQIELANYDIILTTVDLPGFARDYLLVSPLLLNDEAQKIRNYLQTYQYQNANFKQDNSQQALKQLQERKKELDLYLDLVDNVQLFTYQNNEEQTLKEVIKGVIDLLPSAIIIDSQQVAQKLFKRINQSPVGIPNSSLALVHANSSAVRKAYVAVCQLQTVVKMKAMDYDEVRVKRFLLLLAPSKSNKVETKALGTVSSTLVMNNDSVSLFEKGDTSDLKEFLAENFWTLLEQKD